MWIVRQRRAVVFVGGLLALLAAALMGPLATWLQRRDLVLAPGQAADAVYLVAGARAQNLRVGAVLEYARQTAASGLPVTVLIGNDSLVGPWSVADDRCLSMAEWACRKLEPAMEVLGVRARIETVPGQFLGTDHEMEMLARYLEAHRDIGRLALATSRFHARRAVARLEAHRRGPVDVRLVPVRAIGEDRAPWIVAGELGSLARDALGLARAPLLTRRHP